MRDADLRVLIVDQNLMRASILEEGLREAGYRDVIVVRDMQNLLRRIADEAPDVILIDLENPNRDVLEQMFQVSRVVQRPVAMFVDRSDASMIEAAIDAGVGTYVVDGLRKERVKAIVDTPSAASMLSIACAMNWQARVSNSEDRKLIDRARGILMKERNCSEEEAYNLMRKAAMSENMRIAEVAQSIITAARLLR
jgi:response regulator NasT